MLSRQILKVPSKFNMNLMRKIATSAVIRCQATPASSVDYNQLVLVDVNDKSGYATLTLNRPPVNSFNLELLMAFSRALDQVERNNSKGLILASIIPNIFSVGFDVRELYKAETQKLREFWSVVQDVWIKLYGSSYPTAAAINGHNPAAGCFFSLCCEYRVMVKNSKMGISGARLGISIPLPMIYVMKNAISSRDAELALLSGKLFSTEDALKVGLIDEIAIDRADAFTKCQAFLDRFKEIPPLARGITKQSIRRSEMQEILNNRQRDIDDFVKTVLSPEAQDSFEAFLTSSKKKN